MGIDLDTLYKWSLLPQFYLFIRFLRRTFVLASGFTLIELLIVIAIIGILAGAVLVAINPGARIVEARNSRRKADIVGIAKKLDVYATDSAISGGSGSYPGETWCDSSIGSAGSGCPISPPQSDWSSSSLIVVALKGLPKDPINNTTYHYRYEPDAGLYWIGARLEPSSPTKIFRCSNRITLSAGTGCKEVNGWDL